MALLMTVRDFDFKAAYDRAEEGHGSKAVDDEFGGKAYQTTESFMARSSQGMPMRVTKVERDRKPRKRTRRKA